MKSKFLVGCLVLLLSSCLIFTVLVGIVFFNTNLVVSNIVLTSGDTIKGNLVVAGYNATVEEGASVTGSLVCLGGNVMLDGGVDGNLIVFGGNALIADSAVIGGRAISLGGNVLRGNEP